MKNIDILAAFEREIGAVNEVQLKPYTDDSLFWLNQAVAKFEKLRFNGDPVHETGYELTEKRREDLINLLEHVYWQKDAPSDKLTLVGTTNHVNAVDYVFNFPSDFLYELSENVVIADANGDNECYTSVFECTQDSLMYRINNSLTDFHYRNHRARPLRLRTSLGCRLYTDGQYLILKYELTYLRKPNEITLDNPESEYTDFEDNVMYEIIKMAAQMYLENIKSERYKTISNEVLTQE